MITGALYACGARYTGKREDGINWAWTRTSKVSSSAKYMGQKQKAPRQQSAGLNRFYPSVRSLRGQLTTSGTEHKACVQAAVWTRIARSRRPGDNNRFKTSGEHTQSHTWAGSQWLATGGCRSRFSVWARRWYHRSTSWMTTSNPDTAAAAALSLLCLAKLKRSWHFWRVMPSRTSPSKIDTITREQRLSVCSCWKTRRSAPRRVPQPDK